MDLTKMEEELKNIKYIKKRRSENFFNRRIIKKVFYKMVEKFGLEKAWELIIYLQDYVIHKIYMKEENSSIEIEMGKNPELEDDFKWILLELINKNLEGFKRENLLRKTEESKLKKLLSSLKIIQVYLIDEYEKINREELRGVMKKSISKSDEL